MIKTKYIVQESRLLESRNKGWLKKLTARLMVWFILSICRFISFVYKNKTAAKVSTLSKNRFLFIGRFESDNWIRAHIQPLAISSVCEHIWIVSDEKLLDIPNVTYVKPNPKVKKLFGGIISRVYTAHQISKNENIHYVGGFHLLLNGVLAHVIARVNKAKSIYFCVGGWAEVVGGGVYSGTPIFKDIGSHNYYIESQLLKYVKNVDQVITMGRKARKYFIDNGVNRVVVIPGGIDKSALGLTSQIQKSKVDLILVARLDPVKRIDRFLKIVQKLKVLHPSISVLIIGGGILIDQYKNLASELNVSENVTFEGSSNDVGSFLVNAKIFVLTSDSEGLPLSCMEAATFGLPIVASNIGDLSDLIENNINGFLIEKEDISGFVNVISMLLSNEDLANRISKNILKKSGDFSLQTASLSWQKMISSGGLSNE